MKDCTRIDNELFQNLTLNGGFAMKTVQVYWSD